MKLFFTLCVFIEPFAIGAVIHYNDAWIYIPATISIGIHWAGCVFVVARGH